MKNIQQWIWLNKKTYPSFQKTICTTFIDEAEKQSNYCVAEFYKTFKGKRKIKCANIRINADTFFRLYINKTFIGNGPAAAGGDFDSQTTPYWHYANNYEVDCNCDEIEIFVQVQLSPVVMTDISCGRGGLMVECEIVYDNGETQTLITDQSWKSRLNTAYVRPFLYDGRMTSLAWENADLTDNDRPIKNAEIPMLSFEKIYPINENKIVVGAGEAKVLKVEFDKIYSASVCLSIKTGGCEIDVKVTEFGDVDSRNEKIITVEDLEYTDIQFHSMGEYTLEIKNFGLCETTITAFALFQCYPVSQQGSFLSSDKELNKIYDVCKWTLQICRQTLHLDSPKHQEPLACTGDYYIESLMTAFTFGDMRLASLDVKRTADGICDNDGKMFHTTYSLIWLQMIRDVYLFTGQAELISYCKKAIIALLNRFETYLGSNGIIDNPPNYMFVDWVVADGYSMHHPPKALGQTCLNAFYQNGLVVACQLMDIIGDSQLSNKYLEAAKKHKIAHNRTLFDKDKGLYFDGLNTPSESKGYWMPANIDGRYYSKHSNILCVLSGLCEGQTAVDIIERVMNEEFITDLQPYFMHYLFEALKKTGLYEKYAMKELRRWSVMTNECSKGLQEGWIKPEETYSFDHSHAWGGTPAYQLPCAIMGFEMIEPGFKKIALSPNLFDLDAAKVEMPTPFGNIICDLKKGEEPKIFVPEKIEFVIKG